MWKVSISIIQYCRDSEVFNNNIFSFLSGAQIQRHPEVKSCIKDPSEARHRGAIRRKGRRKEPPPLQQPTGMTLVKFHLLDRLWLEQLAQICQNRNVIFTL